MTERTAAVTNKETELRVRVEGAFDFARDAADYVLTRGRLTRLVGDCRTAEFEEEEIVRNKFYFRDDLCSYL